MNKFVDAILDVMEKNAGNRKNFLLIIRSTNHNGFKIKKKNRWPAFQLFEKARKESIDDMVKKVRSYIEFDKK